MVNGFLLFCTLAAGPVTLLSNVTFGGLICSTPAVEFTCTAVDATDVEWQRNGDRIIVFLRRDTIGPSDDPRVPSGFEIELTAAEQDNQGRTNFTTTLTANLSVLLNGGDQISCHSPGGNDSISITYTGQQRKINLVVIAVKSNLYQVVYPQLLLQLPSSLTPSPPQKMERCP